MENINKNVLVAGAVILLLALGAWWMSQNSAHPLPLVEGDTVSSWDFQGTYKDGGALEKKANDEIVRQKSLLGGDQSGVGDDPTDYSIYVGIANQYELLGNGKAAYNYLGRALKIDSEKTGLAWRNLGALLERLGALETARVAYARAVEAQSQIVEYHVVRLQFLIKNFADDASALNAAFDEADKEFGETPEILQVKAQWLEKSGRHEEAASTLQQMTRLMKGFDANVDVEFGQLKSQI